MMTRREFNSTVRRLKWRHCAYMAAMASPDLAPFQGETFMEFFPGLKPWAEDYGHFVAGIYPKPTLT